MNEPDPKLEKQAKLLTVAMELIRREFVDSASFLFANRERAKKHGSDWAYEALKPASPSPAAPQAGEPTTPSPTRPQPDKPIPLAKEDRPAVTPSIFAPTSEGPAEPPPIPLAKPPAETYGLQKPEIPKFNIGSDKSTSAVSAFDKPQAVVIVGPNPLPVKMDGAFKEKVTQPRHERTPEAGGGLAIGKAIATRFLAVLGPLYALSTVLGQANSGMGVFQKSINVFAATLAPVLLPVFAMLAAGLLSISDVIWAKLLPALEGFYRWMLKHGVPIVEEGIAAADDLTGGDEATRRYLDRPEFAGVRPEDKAKYIREADESRPPEKPAPGNLGQQMTVAIKKKEAEEKAASAQGKKNADGTPKVPMGRRFNDNMTDVIKSLAMSMSPKASYAGLGEVGKQAQLAALSQDPIEAKLLRRMITTLEEWQRAWEAKQNPVPANDQQMNRRGGDASLDTFLGQLRGRVSS